MESFQYYVSIPWLQNRPIDPPNWGVQPSKKTVKRRTQRRRAIAVRTVLVNL